jgi:hypothetical protein
MTVSTPASLGNAARAHFVEGVPCPIERETALSRR